MEKIKSHYCPICITRFKDKTEALKCQDSHLPQDYLKLSNLLKYAKQNSKIPINDGPRNKMKRKAKKLCQKKLVGVDLNTPLVPGKYYYDRLILTNTWLQYCPHKDMTTEIYWAVLHYLEKTL